MKTIFKVEFLFFSVIDKDGSITNVQVQQSKGGVTLKKKPKSNPKSHPNSNLNAKR